MSTYRGRGQRRARKQYLADSDAYRDLIERAPSLSEEEPDLEAARTADEQLRLYRESNEQMIRDGRA